MFSSRSINKSAELWKYEAQAARYFGLSCKFEPPNIVQEDAEDILLPAS